MGTAAAAVLLVVATWGMLSAGEPHDDTEAATPDLDIGLPSCTVDVHVEGTGAARRTHVSVSSTNDVRTVWVVADADEPVAVDTDHGWAHLVFPDATLPDEVIVYGSPDLEDFMAGCEWHA